jgi:hypothetical protein
MDVLAVGGIESVHASHHQTDTHKLFECGSTVTIENLEIDPGDQPIGLQQAL